MEHLFIISTEKYDQLLEELSKEPKYLPKMKALLEGKYFEDE